MKIKRQEFIESLKRGRCPEQIDPCLQALWHDAAGDWETAHAIVQAMNQATAARVHAYLHRKEGDDWNARYWHRRAGTRFPADMNLDQEWDALVDLFVE